MKKFVGLVAMVALVGCTNGDSPTGPSPVQNSQSFSEVEQQTTPVAPAPQQTLVPGFWQDHVNFDTNGNLTINNPNAESYDGQYCYFVNGPHPQERLFAGETHVNGGHNRSFNVPDLAEKLENDTCEPITVSVQGDAGAGTFSCNNPLAGLPTLEPQTSTLTFTSM